MMVLVESSKDEKKKKKKIHQQHYDELGIVYSVRGLVNFQSHIALKIRFVTAGWSISKNQKPNAAHARGESSMEYFRCRRARFADETQEEK